jgi:hypothetical protein
MGQQMSNLLDRSFTVRQVWRWTRRTIYVAIPLYIVLFFLHAWNLKMGGIGFRASPYLSMIPQECRVSASIAGTTGSPQTWAEQLLLKPSTRVYSLPASEEKLGFGMRGIPCRGYNFLMLLHGRDFEQVEKYVNESGEVVAVVTTEVIRPYKPPISQSELRALPTWPEIGNPPANDASLVAISKERLK